jgi:GH24 family phage-related lysozyme (muramidase)
MFKIRLISMLASFTPSVEGFIPHPKWDNKQYSWGYGTAAPGPTGTITREQAFADMLSHLLRDYATLSNKITRNLNVSQWTGLLSFSYNLGIGNALNLVPLINLGDDPALLVKWAKYVYADGVVSQHLIERRQKEINLWVS